MLNSMFNYNDKYRKFIYKNKYFSDKIKLNEHNTFGYKNIIKESNDKYINNLLKNLNDKKNYNYIKKEINDNDLQINKVEINNNYFTYFFCFFLLSTLLIYKR